MKEQTTLNDSGTALAWLQYQEARKRFPEARRIEFRRQRNGRLLVIPTEWDSPTGREQRDRRLQEIRREIQRTRGG